MTCSMSDHITTRGVSRAKLLAIQKKASNALNRIRFIQNQFRAKKHDHSVIPIRHRENMSVRSNATQNCNRDNLVVEIFTTFHSGLSFAKRKTTTELIHQPNAFENESDLDAM